MSNILIGVTGSVAAYRILDVTRGLVKAGHKIRIILTKGGLEFVRPEVFKYLGAEAVYGPQDDFKSQSSQDLPGPVLHINLAKWADRIVLAPLSANTLAKVAHGMADDLLCSVVLARRQGTPLLLYPAMNVLMWNNPIVQENCQHLQKCSDVFLHPPMEGELVCGDEGQGKLPSVETLLDTIPFATPASLINKPGILISTGATVVPLDPVRFLTNPSSGITGLFLAQEAHRQGHPITILHGRYSTERIKNLRHLPGVKLHSLDTPNDFLNSVETLWPKHAIYISAAAIGDILFKETWAGKLKKSSLPENLTIMQAPDVLARALQMKGPKQHLIGFAAETDLTENVLREKYHKKPVDLLIGTKVHNGQIQNNQNSGFKTDHAEYCFFENGQITFQGALHKTALAQEILNKVNLWLN
ncbi:MAG: bifunctional phosphopantothenoylcysteine decarboxylase/phosphopantothenate--cysteine ligase CoaBC [Bdellovibrio sp.]|nr:bifunctional phosphopantothenoylcysteine decarboxylase/phosphopantothenate--cysteine ligase CoaBC [Bdellovibrio sp.]